MKPIIHTIPTGGSGRGYHYYRSVATCPRRAWLAKNNPFGEAREIATQIGTIYHALQEVYRSDAGEGFDTRAVEYVHDSGAPFDIIEEARARAEEIFREYRVKFGPRDLGRPIAIEENVASEAGDLWLPDPKMPLTARLDLVVRIDVPTALRIRAKRELNVRPGFYAVDFKTDAYPTPADRDRYVADLQFMIQQFLWNARNPRQQLSGVLIDVAYKTKRPQFGLIYVPPVGDLELHIVRNWLAQMWEYHERVMGDYPPANPTACFDWKRACHWLIQERCDRK